MKIPGWWRIRHFYNWLSLDVRTKQAYYATSDYLSNQSVLLRKKYEISRDSFKVWSSQFIYHAKGLNLIGFAKGDFGLAEHMRLSTKSIKAVKIPFVVINSGNSGGHSTSNTELIQYLTKKNKYKINVFCYNSNFTLDYMTNSIEGKIAFKNYYNINYGYWELSEYPSEWYEQEKYLNEIWAPSKFIKEVLEKKSKLPVYYMPIPVDFIPPSNYSKKHFNLNESAYTFLFSFDMSSYTSRKNPMAVIRAFSHAFPIDKKDNVSLVIKITRVKHEYLHIKAFEELQKNTAFDNRIVFVDEVLDRASILGLISVCECYVSLHRAEGFGLGMAEAMKMGKVVIGTNYSGNTDFMNTTNSCPVNYRLIDVEQNEYALVEKGAQWAEPDEEHAGQWMRKVYDDREFSKQLGQTAKKYMDENWNLETIGKKYQERYKAILKTL